MSNQLRVPCLGRPFRLGMPYDCRTGQIIPGVTLWNALKLKSSIVATEHSTFSTTVEAGFRDKSYSLNIGADIKLSVLSGLIDVNGAAKYFHDRKSSEQQCRVTLQYTSTTHFEELTLDQLGDMQFPKVLDDQEATHVVTGLTYGAKAFLVFDRLVSEGEALDEITARMVHKIKQIRHGGAERFLQASDIDKIETDKFRCKFYGDYIPKSSPITFDEALIFWKNLPEILEHETTPQLAYLVPLSNQVFHPIPRTLVVKAEDIMEHFHCIEVRAHDLQCHELCHKFVDIKNQLSMFIMLLTRFKADFIKKLATCLPKIREGAEAEGLVELVSFVERSPFNQERTERYLKDKEREIKQLTQLLKSMEQYPKIQHDFPDTQKILSNDDKLDHFVCFGFNVTSETCGYLENLKSYVMGGGDERADTEEWFNKPDVIKKLISEMEKFEKLSSITEDSSTVFIATSSNRESNPSIQMYNRNSLKQFVSDMESDTFVQGVQDAVAKDEKINRKLAHSVFVGPTGSGKSSLMDRLLGRAIRKPALSTGVCDGIVIVDIDVDNPSTFHAVTVIGPSTWEEVEYDVSLVSQMNLSRVTTSQPEVKPKPASPADEIASTPKTADTPADSSLTNPASSQSPSVTRSNKEMSENIIVEVKPIAVPTINLSDS